MDKIGTSHIATPDLVLCGITLVLVVYLRRLPRNSIWSRALALLCGLGIFAIIAFLILADDLTHGAVFELAYIAFVLCWSLWEWNDDKVETTIISDASPSDLTK